MVVNNFAAMQFIYKHSKARLSPELLFELHRLLTAGTLDNAECAARLRLPTDDSVAAYDQRTSLDIA